VQQPILSTSAAAAATSVLCDRLAGGILELYAGSKPASPDVEVGPEALLARISLPSPAFNVTADGRADLLGTPLIGSVVQTGAPTWARFRRALMQGGTAELDATVGTADTDPDITTAAAVLQLGSTASILGFSLSLG
jgi:hypothetical protein